MNRLLTYILPVVLFTFVVTACGTDPEKKLIGTWKVDDVQTEFNEQEVTPEMLAQVVELQKQTYFRFINDSVMVIISRDNTHEANWTFDADMGLITYFFEGMETDPNDLGRLENDQIVQESNTPLGKITTTYRKQK